jgi:predicted ATPase/DNA-binding SARP family transcriptional activator
MLAASASSPAEFGVTDSGLRIYLLGTGRATIDGQPVVLRGHPKMWPVLAYLALRAGHMVERGVFAAALWPDVPDATARGNLRRHVAYLSDALHRDEQPWFVRTGGKIGLNMLRPIWVDTAAFTTASTDDTRLHDAKDLYAGTLLSGCDEDWVAAERARFHERYLYVLERLVATERKNRNTAAAITYAADALRADPFREDMLRTIMRLHFEAGDRASALHEFERFSRLLRDELAAEPAADTLRLAAALRSNEPAAPERHTLPIEETSFVGRGADFAQLEHLLNETRLVTIVGAPGVGKTRFALRFAHNAESRFAEGARFIDLSALTRPEELDRAVEHALEDRVRARPGACAPLEARLQHKQLLVVLDNCEHLAPACAKLASRLLRAAPRVCVVATSRCALKARSEAVFHLDPLPAGDAKRLFFERARFARRELTSEQLDPPQLDAIVRATDGLPLALELCAARLRTLSLAEIVARLERPFAFIGDQRTDDAQLRTLRASLESSYQLLSSAQQRLLRRCSVFAGPATSEAIRAVALEELDAYAASEALAQLVDQSLLVAPGIDASEQRYRMLQSIAEFAREKLERDADAQTIRARHARYFAERYVVQDATLRGAQAHERFELIVHDHDDLRAVLARLIVEREDPELGARLALALSRFWFDRGYVREGAAWLEAALNNGGLDDVLRALVLHAWATLIRNQGDYERAFELFGDARTALLGCGDARTLGKAHATYANAARMVGAYDVAREAAIAAYRTFETTDDAYLCGYAVLTYGCIAFSSGDLSAARTSFQRALSLYRTANAQADVALALGNLGSVAYYEHDLAAAAALSIEAAACARDVGNVYYEASATLTLARIAAQRNDRPGAARALLDTRALVQTIADTELQIGCIEVASWLCRGRDAALGALLLGALDVARGRYHILQSPAEQAESARLRRLLEDELSASAFSAAVAIGGALSLDEAVKRAAHAGG